MCLFDNTTVLFLCKIPGKLHRLPSGGRGGVLFALDTETCHGQKRFSATVLLTHSVMVVVSDLVDLYSIISVVVF